MGVREALTVSPEMSSAGALKATPRNRRNGQSPTRSQALNSTSRWYTSILTCYIAFQQKCSDHHLTTSGGNTGLTGQRNSLQSGETPPSLPWIVAAWAN